MKHLMFSIIISVLVLFFAGCSMHCFYQADKSIEQCEQDLLECAYSGRPIYPCMQERGYQYLDADTLPQNRKRKKIAVLFQESGGSGGHGAISEEYWIVNGRDRSSDNFKIVYEPGTQIADPNAPPRKLIGYRFRQDDFGKFTKTPVYEDEQKSSVEEYLAVDGRDRSSENFKIVFEPGTQITDPNAPPRKLIGYRVRQDDFGKFTKTPVYEDQ